MKENAIEREKEKHRQRKELQEQEEKEKDEKEHRLLVEEHLERLVYQRNEERRQRDELREQEEKEHRRVVEERLERLEDVYRIVSSMSACSTSSTKIGHKRRNERSKST